MAGDFDDDYEITPGQAEGLLEELELNQAVDIRDVRERATTHLAAEVVVRPGNLRERHSTSGTGKAREIQGQCMTCVLDQPLLVGSHHGRYAIVTVGKVDNLDALAEGCLERHGTHFSELKGNEFNQTEVVAGLINRQDTLVDGLRHVHQRVKGSCSVLLLTDHEGTHLHYFPTFHDLINKVEETLLVFKNTAKEVLSLFGLYKNSGQTAQTLITKCFS